MNYNLSIKEDLRLDETQIEKLIKNWVKLRKIRVKNQVTLLNYISPYSYIIKKQFIKFISSFARGNFEISLNKMKTLSEYTEKWLGDMWTCLINSYVSQNILTKNDWAFIKEVLETNIDKILLYLNKLLPSAEGDLRFVLLGVHTFSNYMKSNDGSFKHLFNEDSEFAIKLLDRYVNEIEEVAGRTLFTELCIEMAWLKTYGIFAPVSIIKSPSI